MLAVDGGMTGGMLTWLITDDTSSPNEQMAEIITKWNIWLKFWWISSKNISLIFAQCGIVTIYVEMGSMALVLYTDQSGSKSIHMVLECRCNNKFKFFFHQTIYIKLAQMIWIHKNLQGRIEQIHQLRLFCKPVSQSKEDRSQAARPFGRSQLTWPHPRVLRLQTFQTFEVYT